MSSKHIRGDFNVAGRAPRWRSWAPGRREHPLPRGAREGEGPGRGRKRLVAEYNDKFASPWVAAELGYLDDVIDPLDTRPRLIAALEMLRNKRQNLPPRSTAIPALSRCASKLSVRVSGHRRTGAGWAAQGP